MARLLLACPSTGATFATTFDGSREAFDELLRLNLWIGCPECGGAHVPTEENTSFAA